MSVVLNKFNYVEPVRPLPAEEVAQEIPQLVIVENPATNEKKLEVKHPSKCKKALSIALRTAQFTAALLKCILAFTLVPAYMILMLAYRAAIKPVMGVLDTLQMALWIPFVPMPLVAAGLTIKTVQLSASLIDCARAIYQEPLFMIRCQKSAISDFAAVFKNPLYGRNT